MSEENSADVRIARLERELRELRAGLRASEPRDVVAGDVAVLVLRAGAARFAIPLADVVEVIPRVQLMQLPEAPPSAAGYMRWRGEHVPVLDVGARWHGEPSPVRLEDRIVIVRQADGLRGLLVPDVEGVDTLLEAERTAVPPDTTGAAYALALAARGDSSIVLLSPERLLDPGVPEAP